MQPKTDFAIIPDRKSIASVEREIRFFPSENSTPSALSTDQIATWNRDGYLGPLDVYSEAEVKEIREYFDELLTDTMANGGDSYSISSAHLKHSRVWDMLTHPTIVGYVTDLLGEDVVVDLDETDHGNGRHATTGDVYARRVAHRLGLSL